MVWEEARKIFFYGSDGAKKSSVQSLFLGRGYCDIGYIGMCHCEGYGFQAVFSGIGYINQRVWV